MLTITIAMLIILLFAIGVVVYAAYPARGHKTPVVPWVGEAMEKAADAMPTLEAEQSHEWSLRR